MAIRPRYVRGIFWGQLDRFVPGRAKSGGDFLDQAAVDYARRLMEQEDWQVPADELPILRDILITLVDDPDPESRSDRAQEDWTEHNDPATVAISHVRPKALSVLINYACYVARREDGKDQKGFGAKRLEPSIEQTLTRKVDWRNDPSLSVHFIFGQCLNQLCWLDMERVKTHLNEIFPEGEDDTSTAFFDIAWSSYVSSRQGVCAELFGLLRDIYGRAIKRLKDRYQTKTCLNLAENFASHLIVEYLYADYDLHPVDGQQSLIVQFFNEMPSDVRRQAAWRLASVYQYNKKDEQLAVKLWQRTRALWQWRLDEAARMEFSSDFAGEMEGLSSLLEVLPKQETIASMSPFLEGLLHYVAWIERHDRFWHHLEEYLSRAVRDDPVRAIQFFGWMHDRLEQPLLYYSDDARTILEVGVERIESRNETLLLLEKIAREGHYGFNPLYEKYAALSGRE